MEALFREHKICAIFRGIPKNIFLPYAKALYDGGIRLFEVSMTDPDAEKEITWLKEELQKDAVIGAGTIIDREAFLGRKACRRLFICRRRRIQRYWNYVRKNGSLYLVYLLRRTFQNAFILDFMC